MCAPGQGEEQLLLPGDAEHSSAGVGCTSKHFYIELWVVLFAVGLSLLLFCLPSGVRVL